jgi:hypothetical protein
MNSNNHSLLIYGNVLIESERKLDFFKFTLPLWVDFWEAPTIIRVRGQHAREAEKFARNLRNVELRTGSEYLTWRAQVRADLAHVPQTYVFQYFEDHMPHPDASPPGQIVSQLRDQEPDILQYSWHPSYLPLRDMLLEFGAGVYSSMMVQAMSRSMLKKVGRQTGLYSISLTSVFKREFFLRLLGTVRPIVRRFDPTAPFDVEQRATSSWFAPIRFALPVKELGTCIDDDHLVSGSSAMSRGLFPDSEIPREFNHHSATSFRKNFGHKIPTGTGAFPVALSRILTLLDIALYSLRSPIFHFIDSHKSNSEIKNHKPPKN